MNLLKREGKSRMISQTLLGAIVIFLCMTSLVVGVVFAEWTEGSGYNLGSWESYSASSWKGIDDGNETYFVYVQNISNFQRWYFEVQMTNSHIEGYWWLSTMRQQTWVRIANRDNPSEYVEGDIDQNVHLSHFGMLSYMTGWDFPKAKWGMTHDKTYWVGINLYKNASDVLSIELACFKAKDGNSFFMFERDSYDVSSSFFNNVTLTFKVWKRLELGAVGWVQGEKDDEVLTSGGVTGSMWGSMEEYSLAQAIASQIWSGLGMVKDAVMSVLPAPVRELLNSVGGAITGFGGLAFGLLAVLFGLVTSNYVLILGLWGMYELYHIVKLIEGGDFTQYIEHWKGELRLILAIGNIILAIARTIVALIKWW